MEINEMLVALSAVSILNDMDNFLLNKHPMAAPKTPIISIPTVEVRISTTLNLVLVAYIFFQVHLNALTLRFQMGFNGIIKRAQVIMKCISSGVFELRLQYFEFFP